MLTGPQIHSRRQPGTRPPKVLNYQPEADVSITRTILEDHARRKDAHGVAWFDLQDLARLGIQEGLMTTLQNVQHVLRSTRSPFTAETLGALDRFSVRTTH